MNNKNFVYFDNKKNGFYIDNLFQHLFMYFQAFVMP